MGALEAAFEIPGLARSCDRAFQIDRVVYHFDKPKDLDPLPSTKKTL